MKKREMTFALLLLLITALIVGCSPATTDDTANTIAIQKLETEIASQKERIERFETDLAATKLEKDALEIELETLKATNSTSTTLLGSALNVLQALANQDMAAFSSYVHPTSGVRFTPYAYVNPASDLSFPSTAFSALISDTTLYTWGAFDGSGEPMIYTFSDYLDNFVYDEDYLNPHLIGINNFIGTGNSLNNIMTEYPTASTVEFHFNGFDPQYGGIDWTSLILVFENVGGNWKLVGIVHNQWTI